MIRCVVELEGLLRCRIGIHVKINVSVWIQCDSGEHSIVKPNQRMKVNLAEY